MSQSGPDTIPGEGASALRQRRGKCEGLPKIGVAMVVVDLDGRGVGFVLGAIMGLAVCDLRRFSTAR